MPPLPREDWPKLSQYQRWALEILTRSGQREITPDGPQSIKTAMHDLWRFGLAERKFGPTRYTATLLGRRAAQELNLNLSI